MDAEAPDLFTQIAREPRLSDKVADMMLETILLQQLSPGTPLPSERELGEQFGVSRTVIREAVRALGAKGVVNVRSGSGLRVAAVDQSRVSESLSWFIHGGQMEYPKVHEIRTMVEVEMAGLAAERRTDEELAGMQAIHDRFAEAADTDVDASATLDLDFHAAIALATQNELFSVILTPIGGALIQVRRGNLSAGAARPTVEEHAAILRAIERKQQRAARKAMRDHLDRVAALWNAQHENGEAPGNAELASAAASRLAPPS